MSGRGRHPQRNAHWTGQPCCTDFLHCCGTCSYLPEASRLVKNCGLHIRGSEWACAGASPPSSSGRHTNHAPSLRIRFSSGRAPTSTWVIARWVPTRSVLFTAKMDTVVQVLSCFYVHSQVSASLPKPDAWPCSFPPSRRHSSHTCITLALPSQFWLKKASAAKFSTKHSKLLCSSSHMILPFKGSKNKTNFQHSITTFKIIRF